MAVTVLKTQKGNSTGPSSYIQFNVVVQLGYDGSDSTGYNMYVRYYVSVTKSSNTSNFVNNLHVSWTDTTYGMSKVGDYAISNWISLGKKAYGTKVTASANCWYERNSGGILKSSAEASYTIPIPTYSVSYNPNGGIGAPNYQTKYHGTDLVLSSVKPTREGYNFLGWGWASSSTVASFSPGGKFTGDYSVMLYAVWQIKTYEVLYDANGGTNAPSGQSKIYGVALPLQTAIPTRTNYNFLGWATNNSATTPTYKSGDSYTNNASVTLYAVWELAYIKPRINNLTVFRCKSDGSEAEDGTNVKIKFDWETDKTNARYVIYYKKNSETDYLSGIAVDMNGTSGSVETIIKNTSGNVIFDTEYSYDIQLNVSDSLGYSYSDKIINALFIQIDSTEDGRCMSFGEPAKDDEKDVLRFTYKTVDIAPKEQLLYKGKPFEEYIRSIISTLL